MGIIRGRVLYEEIRYLLVGHFVTFKTDTLISTVSKGAKIGQTKDLWIGVADIGEENVFTYISDGTLVNLACEDSFNGRAGKQNAIGYHPINLYPDH